MLNNYCKQKTISNYLEQCNSTKVILMITVMLYHSCLFMANGWFPTTIKFDSSSPILIFAGWLNSFHVYAFVLISGFVFYYNKNEKHKYQKYKLFVINKTRRLIVPAIFITIIWVVPFAEMFFHYNTEEIVSRYLLAIAPNQLWFLWMLFWVFIISWPLSTIFTKPWSCIVVMLLYVIGSFGGNVINNYLQIWKGLEFVLYFYIGYLLCHNLNRLPHFKRYSILLLLVNITCYIALQYIQDYSVLHKVAAFGIKLLMTTSGSISIFALLSLCSSKINLSGKSYFSSICKKTMTMFLFHQQLIYLSIWWFCEPFETIPVLLVIINFGVSFIGSYLISVVFDQFKITRILVGAK